MSTLKRKMVEENVSTDLIDEIDKTWNYLLEEIEQRALTIKKQKKVCVALNYIKQPPF